MIDKEALASQINIALTELRSDSMGILPIGRRMKICVAMIDRQDGDQSYRNRISLQKKSVRHVQHFWTSTFPNNPSLEGMLTLAHQVVEGQVSPGQAEMTAYRFFQDIDGAAINPENNRTIMVADAAQQLVISACYRDPFADIDETLKDDDDLLPDSLDCSYACASAAAGGLNWQPVDEVDVDARRAFWLWYLDVAIPEVLRGQ